MAMQFSNDEMNLMCIYSVDSETREGLIIALTDMLSVLGADEIELRTLTERTIIKLNSMSDEDFDALELIPDYEE